MYLICGRQSKTEPLERLMNGVGDVLLATDFRLEVMAATV
jgi:hypothetical protein